MKNALGWMSLISSFFWAIAGLVFLALTIRSVDYHDGAYHPIPRERYALTAAGCIVASIVSFRTALAIERRRS